MDFYGINALDDVYVPGDTLFIGTGKIKSAAGNLELYDSGTKVLETTSSGLIITGNASTALIEKSAGGDLNVINESLNDDVGLFVTNGVSALEKVFFGIEGGAAELYFDGVKVAETTANGISGAVWG